MLFISLNDIGRINYDKDPIYVKIFDLHNKHKVILDTVVQDPDMKGIFVSGDYVLNNGHIYFNNNVIKLRYDLMQQFGTSEENQEIIFNKYFEILKLSEHESIKTNSPMDSI